MSITLKTHKLLWGKSGNKCAFPECRKELVESETETDDFSIIGEEAHIVGRKKNGPRGKSVLPLNERDKFDNLILLCRNHHKQIDDQPNTYPVELLKDLKQKHLEWIKGILSTEDEDKQYDDQIYAEIIQKWIELSNLNNWKGWTSSLFAPHPELHHESLEDLHRLSDYLFTRIWPKRYLEIEDAFENHRIILNDLLRVFKTHAIKKYSYLRTESFYKIRDGEYSEQREWYLYNQWEYHVDLVHDLTLELTRSSNQIISVIRRSFYRNFRESEGVVTIQIPFQGDLKIRGYRVEYKRGENTKYQNLETFMIERENRDYSLGKGISDKY